MNRYITAPYKSTSCEQAEQLYTESFIRSDDIMIYA